MTETSWSRSVDWKARYSKLYSSRGLSLTLELLRQICRYLNLVNPFSGSRDIRPKKEETSRISFMNNDTTPYASLLSKIRRESSSLPQDSLPLYLTSLMSQHSECYGSTLNTSMKSDDLGGHETLLMDMVRSRSCEARDEVPDQPLPLPREEKTEYNLNPPESCVHGLSYRGTERSVSRSRVSRMSMRRDMDIPSILAFTASPIPSPVCLEIPGFQKVKPPGKDIPRWSIRRSVCPVCSQKWRDKSSIRNIKYSGLKRNLSNELPSVIAPARIRTAVAMEYVPRSLPPPIDKDTGSTHGTLRNGSASWLLTRARRFRAPKLQMPPPEATAPPSCSAPLARKDLDARVSLFLSDQFRLK